jgi:dimethylargininase
VLDEVAVICTLGTETRRKEAASIAAALEPYRKLARVKLPGVLEGGDVLRVGKKIIVGLTQRSNAEGIRQLAVIAGNYGYDLTAVPVTGCLHLKSAVTYLGRNTLLGNREWFHWKRFEGFDWVDVDPGEPRAGNALAVGESIVFPASFPKTRARIEARGFRVETLDIAELQKAESGLTCSSLLFDAAI